MLTIQMQEYIKFASAKRTDGFAPSTANYLLKLIGNYENWLDVNGLEPDKLSFHKWLTDYPVAVSSKHTIVKMLTKYLVWYNYITKDESKELKGMFSVPDTVWSSEVITEEHVLSLLRDVTKGEPIIALSYTRLRDLAMMFIFSTIGLRAGQISDMKLTDFIVDTEHSRFQILVEKQKQNLRHSTLVKEVKKLPFSYAIGEFTASTVLFPFLKERNKREGEYLFQTGKDLRYTRKNIYKTVTKYSSHIGENIHPHSLRHFVGHKIANTMGVFKASIHLGHSNIKTTQKYINPNEIEILV